MIYRFGDHTLDTESFRLTANGEEITVEPQVFTLLLYLVEHRDHVVSKDEMIEHVWDGRIVSDSTLTSRINSVRRAVRDDGKSQAVIRTFPRRGIRFVAAVAEDNDVSEATLPIPDRPALAVLPFENLSGDAEQEFFADGVTDDLISALSRFHQFFVIARNSSFVYKGRPTDVKQIAREQGVRYVIEGSVRRSQSRVRVGAQLIDATTGLHLWAERFNRPLADLFEMQDEITDAIISVLAPAIEANEIDRARRNPPENLGAWEIFHRGLWHYHRPLNADDQAEARRLFVRAAEADPSFADPHALLALMDAFELTVGIAGSREQNLASAAVQAEKAVRLDEGNALAHAALSHVRQERSEIDAAIAEAETAIALNPNLAMAHHFLGGARLANNQADLAIRCYDMALRRRPTDPQRWGDYLMRSLAFLRLEKYQDAWDDAKAASILRPNSFWPHVHIAAALMGLGRPREAHVAILAARECKPDLNLDFVEHRFLDIYGSSMKPVVELVCEAGLHN